MTVTTPKVMMVSGLVIWVSFQLVLFRAFIFSIFQHWDRRLDRHAAASVPVSFWENYFSSLPEFFLLATDLLPEIHGLSNHNLASADPVSS